MQILHKTVSSNIIPVLLTTLDLYFQTFINSKELL